MLIQTIEEINGQYMSIEGVTKPVLNVASNDFLRLSNSPEVIKASIDALDFYGCGSCGPRGFYGTIDQHLLLEQAIAQFMGTEVCNQCMTDILNRSITYPVVGSYLLL